MRFNCRRLSVAIAVSFVLHLAVGAAFFSGRAPAPTLVAITLEYAGEQTGPPPQSTVPAGTTSPSAATRAARKTERTHRRSSSRPGAAPDISLAQLRTKWQLPPLTPGLAMTTEDRPAPYTWTQSQAYDGVGPSSSDGVSMGEDDFYGSLWRMIDQAIEDNPFLSEYNHSGQVFLRFAVDAQGHLERRSFQAAAADRVLKVIAARAVRKAVRNETGDVHFQDKPLVVNARFAWSTYEACRSQRGHRGNFLTFCHYAENKRKTFSSGEKVATYAKSFYNYGPWGIEEIRKYNREQSRRRTQFSPFEEYERDPDWNL